MPRSTTIHAEGFLQDIYETRYHKLCSLCERGELHKTEDHINKLTAAYQRLGIELINRLGISITGNADKYLRMELD